MKKLTLIIAVLFMGCTDSETEFKGLKFPAIVISATQNTSHGYGSICIKDSEGKMWIGHGETYLANTLIQNYQKGDTIK